MRRVLLSSSRVGVRVTVEMTWFLVGVTENGLRTVGVSELCLKIADHLLYLFSVAVAFSST